MENKLFEIIHAFVTRKIGQSESGQLFCFGGLSFALLEKFEQYVREGHPLRHNGADIGLYVLDQDRVHPELGSFVDEAGTVALRNDANHHFVLLTPYGASCSMSVDTTVEMIGVEDEAYSDIDELSSDPLYREIVNKIAPAGTEEGRYLQELIARAVRELLQNDNLFVSAVWEFLDGLTDAAGVDGLDVATAEAYCGCPCTGGAKPKTASKLQKDFFKALKDVLFDSTSYREFFEGLRDEAEEGQVPYSVDAVDEFSSFVSREMARIDTTPHLAFGEKFRRERVEHSWWRDLTAQEMIKIIKGNEDRSALGIEAVAQLCGSTSDKKQPILFNGNARFEIKSNISSEDTLLVRKGKRTSPVAHEEDIEPNGEHSYEYALDDAERKKGGVKLFFSSKQTNKIFSYDVISLPSLKSGMYMTIKDVENLAKVKPFKIKNKNSSKTFRTEITVAAPGDMTCFLYVNEKSRVLLKPIEYDDAQKERQYFNFQHEEMSAGFLYSVRLNVFNELTFKFKGYVDGVEYTYEVVFYVKESRTVIDVSETYYDEHVRRNLLRKNGPVSHSDYFEVTIPAGRDIYSLERTFIVEATAGTGGYPIVLADDYRDVLLSGNRPDFANAVSYTRHDFGTGSDTRPDYGKWKQSALTYGQHYFASRQKLFSLFETEFPERCIEEIDLAHVSPEFEFAVNEYARSYLEWLRSDYVNASVAETLWVYPVRENNTLVESPSQIILPSTHPLRLAWQLWAQKLMLEAEAVAPCPAVAIFESDAVPDMLYVPLATIGDRDRGVHFAPAFSVKSTSRYWGVMNLYDSSTAGTLKPQYLWSEEFGLSFETSSRTITKDQVESALNDAREMCMAKPSLSISFNGDSGRSICREGILSWNQQFFDEDNAQVSQLGPRRLKIYDVKGQHTPSKEMIAAICDQSEGAIQWFSPDRVETRMDISIATLAARESNVRESSLGNSVTAAGGLACYRSRQLCNGSYVIESRRTTSAKDWRRGAGSLQEVVSDILDGYASPAGVDVSGLNTHIGFPTDVHSLVAEEDASYYAISSADVDHACFVTGGGRNAYLWDYRLPQNNPGSRNTDGFYLLAKESSVMFRAVEKAIASISGGSSTIPEQVIKNTLHITAQRGIPTIKDLTLGGTKALGEVGILVAVSMLQGDITDSITKGLFPPYLETEKNAWLNFVVPFDPFRRQFEALLTSSDRKVRPDLACVSVCCEKTDGELRPVSMKYSFLEVKTRTNQFADTEKIKALAQYSTCHRVLSEALSSECFKLRTLAVYDLLVGLFTFGFRVYGTFNGAANLNLDSFYTAVVKSMFDKQDFVRLEADPRLLIVDSAETLAMDKRNGVHCTVRVNNVDACNAIAAQRDIPLPVGLAANWNMLASTQGSTLAAQKESSRQADVDSQVGGSAEATTVSGGESSAGSQTQAPTRTAQPSTGVEENPPVAPAGLEVNAGAARVEEVITPELREEIETVRTSLLKALGDSDIKGTLIEDPKVAPNSIVFTFDGQPSSMSPNVIRNKMMDFKVHYGVEIIGVVPKRLKVCVHVKRANRQKVDWTRYWPMVSAECLHDKKLFLGIGEEDGRMLFLDPAGEHGPHTLVAGATKSGKSVLLRNLLYSIGSIYSPLESRIVLIDPKRGQDYFAFSGMPHFFGSDTSNVWISNQARARLLLRSLVTEMERRVDIMSGERCEDLSQYQAKINDPKSPKWIPRLWVFHDEFAMWMLDRDYKRMVEDTIAQLSVMARSAGIHLVFATQRPSNEVVSVQTRNNLSNRLILKVQDEGTSTISIGRPGAESLLGQGHILIRRDGEEGDEPVEGQVAFHDKRDVENGVAEIIANYSGLELPDPMELLADGV